MKRLKILREEKGLTYKDLQNLVNINYATLSQYEKGDRIPSLERLKILADFYKVSTDYILENSDFKNADDSLKYILNNLKDIELSKENLKKIEKILSARIN